jgi:hypothetical protein
MKKKIFIIIILLWINPVPGKSQSLAVNTDGSSANASAILDVKSTAKGLLIPRMSRAQRNAISTPATGLLIFQDTPDSIGFYYYNGSGWTWMFSNANSDSLAWRTGGNTGTVDGSNFIGTKDNIPFNIRVNNQKAGRIDPTLFNTFLGYQSGIANTSGSQNTAYGKTSLYSNTIGINNTALGVQSLYFNTNGNENTGLGPNALFYNNSGSGNVAAGLNTMFTNTSGNYNTALGYYALGLNSTGYSNVAVGVKSMYTNVGTSNLVAVGDSSLFNNTGTANTAIGSKTMYTNSTGINNMAAGYNALYSNTTGNNNTANGYRALYYNSTADDNTALGTDALFSNSTGTFNTAAGFYALRNNTLGVNNTAVGTTALYFNTTAGKNTALGYDALFSQSYSNTNTAWNSENVAIGNEALYSNQPTAATNGYLNTAVGSQSLHTNTTGYKNTTLGNSSGYGLTTGSGNVFLGYQAGFSETTGSNKLYIANSSSNPPLIYGDFSTARVGLGTTSPGDKLEVNGNIRFTGIDTVYAAPSAVGSGNSIWLRAGNPYVPVGGAGGSIYIEATNNMPSGGSGYGNLGISGSINLTAGSGYNTAGGNVNIAAGASSYWALANDSHSDVIIRGGYNMPSNVDAASLTTEGGHVISFNSSASNGGNLILKPGSGVSGGNNGYIKLDGVVTLGYVLNIAGGASGSPVSLLNQPTYIGVLPVGTNNYYQLPDPTVYPGRTYIIRNNSSLVTAVISTAGATLLFPGNSNTGSATYTLNPTSSPKTVMAVSDGANWSMLVQN